jgi:hypothetical protein
MSRLKVVALILLSLLITPTVAQAFDIPLLTWERGRDQQVVLGGGAYVNNWKVTLEGEGIAPVEFKASEKNAAGYIVYTVALADDFKLGPYSVVTVGDGSPRTVVAGVNIIAAQSNTATSQLFSLTLIIAITIFLTGIVSTIRARKYLFIPFKSEQALPRLTDPIALDTENFWVRLEAAPYRIRVRTLTSLNQSLLRFLLIREGELSHRISKGLYGALPFAGLIAGVLTAVTIKRNDGIANTSMTIFIIVAALAILDGFSGLVATLGFWAGQLFTGQVTSVQEVLITFAIGLAWVGPSLFASLLREVISRDFGSPSIRGENPVKYFGVIGSSLVGAAVFYLGQALVNSVIYLDHQSRSLSITSIAIVAGLLLARGFADTFINSSRELDLRDESFYIARTNSPVTAAGVLLIVFGFVTVWTQSTSRSLYIGVIFALPYFLAFIRFNKILFIKTDRIRRNILLESLVISGIAFIIFRQVSVQPLLTNQRADLMLLLAGIAPVIHSIYSAIYSSNEEKFSFAENQEIIEP